MIAFALCYAGRDCAANVAVIESAFDKPSPFKGFYADEAQEMLNRLIDKANQEGRQDEVKNLLVKLLAAAPGADGAQLQRLTGYETHFHTIQAILFEDPSNGSESSIVQFVSSHVCG
jgi:hypothetical protein